MGYIDLEGNSGHLLKSDGSLGGTSYLYPTYSGSTKYMSGTLTINSNRASYFVYRVCIGGYAIGVIIFMEIALGCFPNSSTYQKSTTTLDLDSAYWPKNYGSVNLLCEGRFSGNNGEGKNVKLNKDGYVYVCGINAHQMGSSSSNPTYVSSSYVKCGCSYFIDPIKI